MSPEPGAEKPERLQKVLAAAGVASRRASEELIKAGRVAVNGKVVKEMGIKVGPDDVVTVDGRPIQSVSRKLYLMLNKPTGYVTTAADELGRPTALDLVAARERLFPVGRLDADSEGLLLLTNDGEFAYRLTHPRFAVEKEYLALIDSSPTDAQLETLRRGVMLDERLTAPAKVERWRSGPSGTWLLIVIHEGRKRQIRRMLAAIGYNTRRLIRVRIGPVTLGNLPLGRYRSLKPSEVSALSHIPATAKRKTSTT